MNVIEQCVHESPLIADTVCNGCVRIDVRVEHRRMGDREKYYCRVRRGYFDPHKVDSCYARANVITDVYRDVSEPFNKGLL